MLGFCLYINIGYKIRDGESHLHVHLLLYKERLSWVDVISFMAFHWNAVITKAGPFFGLEQWYILYIALGPNKGHSGQTTCGYLGLFVCYWSTSWINNYNKYINKSWQQQGALVRGTNAWGSVLMSFKLNSLMRLLDDKILSSFSFHATHPVLFWILIVWQCANSLSFQKPTHMKRENVERLW